MDKDKIVLVRQLNAIRDLVDIALMGLMDEEPMDEDDNNCKE